MTTIKTRYELPITPLYQGQTNGCGTTSLAMALNYLSNEKSQSPDQQPYTQAALDVGNRELDSFSAPGMLATLAQKKGFYAGQYNEADYEEVRSHLEKKHPILALTKPFWEDNALHYVVIHGYEEGDRSEESKLVITDPADSIHPEQKRLESFQEFCTKQWNNLKLKGLPTQLNRFMLVLSHQNDLPPNRNVPVTVDLANWVNNGINLFASLTQSIFGEKFKVKK
jgi:hypothetical protein